MIDTKALVKELARLRVVLEDALRARTPGHWVRIPKPWIESHTPEPAATAGGEVA